jgi:hypothetical protein
MRMFSRLAVTAVAVGLGSLLFAGPASADPGGDPIPVSSGATAPQTPGSGPNISQPAGDDAQASASKKKNKPWRGGAVWDEASETWRAYITNGDDSAVWGSYDNREDAQNQGEAQAEAMNPKFVDAPGCKPPVLC